LNWEVRAIIIHINHTGLTVSDLDRSVRFYRDLLGLTVDAERSRAFTGEVAEKITGFPGAAPDIVLLRAGDLQALELIAYRAPKGKAYRLETCDVGSGHVCFETDDIQGLVQRLRAAGVVLRSDPVPLQSPQNKGGYALYLLDPDGYTVELVQRPRHSCRSVT
jgi:catechol 2,3-dioxygenase-like lactoylglutathione lyase family enzyme